ncbi:MAG: hypothetical protein KBC73_15270 [Burkholderiaceae bacterium]|nr:hypothetical protein [Burkholderiaceae bacterium]
MSPPRLRPLTRGPAPARRPPAGDLELLRQGYQRSGGLVTADALLLALRRSSSQPLSLLARWIVERRVLSLSLAGQTLLPRFQFGALASGLKPGLEPAMAELAPVFDDGELLQWWARANSALGGAAPADRLDRQPDEVRQAARLDRFIASGG